MNNCQGCQYYADMQKLISGEVISWGSTLPHPCVSCKRFPKDKQELPDNFCGGYVKVEEDLKGE